MGGPAINPAGRSLAIDAFRGLTILAMVLVNNPGTWAHVYAPLRHAEWHGCTPTDLIFPFFLFIVGSSMAFSLSRWADGAARPPAAAWTRMARRAALLFGLGLFMAFFMRWDLGTLRIPGVLQRIALCYAIAAPIVVLSDRGGQIAWAVLLLVAYTMLMMLAPSRDLTGAPVSGLLTPEANFAGYVDRLLPGAAHIYRGGPTDPEGLVSTLTATVTTLAGYWAGVVVRTGGANRATAARLAAAGAVGIAAGLAWSLIMPMNKPLWTGPYTLYTAGWACVVLGLMVWAEGRGQRATLMPMAIPGMNAILVFVASGLLARFIGTVRIGEGDAAAPISARVFETVSLASLPAEMNSLTYALLNVALWWAVSAVLWKRGWFLKV